MSDTRSAMPDIKWRRQPFQAGSLAQVRLKTSIYAGLVLLFTILFVLLYYLNHPQPAGINDPDGIEYLAITHNIQATGQIVDAHRPPGFPLLMVLVFSLVGQDNYFAVGIANAILFTVATLEIYLIALLVFQRRWLALLIGVLIGTNLVFLSLVKGIGPEAFAFTMLASLALSAILFLRTLHMRYLWLVFAFSLGLFITRAEWVIFPLPLWIYLSIVALRRGSRPFRLLSHAITSLVLFYAIVAGYIYINTTQNHYFGLSDIQNINLWGKVMQYDMQNEGSTEYTSISQITNTYRSHGGTSPYDLLKQYPDLNKDHFERVGAYSRSIIVSHPTEYLTKSVPVALYPWRYFYYQQEADRQGPFGAILIALQEVYHLFYRIDIIFPLIALAWIVLLLWRRTRNLPLVQATGMLVLLVLYGIVITTLVGYDSYTRLQMPYTPLLMLVLWSSLLVGGLQIFSALLRRSPAKAES